MDKVLKVGVVGVGRLGRFHAAKYKALENVDLVGLADIDQDRARAVAREMGVAAFFSHRDLIGQVDAVSVAVPTRDHFLTAREMLDAGVHVLVEKPVTRTLAEADRLIALARRKKLVLQVGHLERFNPAMVAARPLTSPPLFIEADRISPFPERGTDVDVVLDLMIHDIDLVLNLVGEEPLEIHAVGTPVVTGRVDIANARLHFETGCVANLTASRISVKSERKLRLFQRDAYLSIDFGQKKVDVVRRLPSPPGAPPEFKLEALEIEANDALEFEIRSFVSSITEGTRPVVDGADGRRALAAACRIIDDLQTRQAEWIAAHGPLDF